MRMRPVLSLSLSCALVLLVSSCSSDKAATKSGPVGTDAGEPSDALYVRLGKADGIQAVVTDFLGRVEADSKINGYFLNTSVDATHLSDCLVKQIGSLAGGPEKYDCKSMSAAHSGLAISKNDFDDLVGDLSAALVAAQVGKSDIDTILGALGEMSSDIVEDQTNDQSIYQRIGRKPAIESVVTDFHARVAADTQINSFFATTDKDRLATWLVRQVCMAAGGPCEYGEEILGMDGGLQSACRSMKESHLGLNIAVADFDELVTDLTSALDAAGVPTADKTAILGVLGPMCPDIVEKGTCP